MPKDKFFKVIANKQHPNEELVPTHCSYCGMQCGMNLRVDKSTNKIIGVEPRYDWPVTLGKMCPKGVTAYQQTIHDDRLLRPLIRDDASLKGTKEGFREASWDEAYELIVSKFGLRSLSDAGLLFSSVPVICRNTERVSPAACCEMDGFNWKICKKVFILYTYSFPSAR